ncbi:zinc finger CCCH domain-containing protein 20 [Tripterygium wilfordii]|uniref:Zinc finger CCCH domain-containing protein 20 n=1 Tax=Tripterygium wilfordii TaxID=458696 RepID=A0A7J7DA96_TRIWF|nr:zinc finger CCCH domain-containing protein 23-like [Tripterygium wilfordii]KAF5743214.1 zinc finger CCCH domain-containing protein 20 [Tripterygium wilfordii]
MMIGETTRRNTTVQIPQWDPFDDPTVAITSPFSVADIDGNANGGVPDYPQSPLLDSLTALHRYLPSNEFVDSDPLSDESDFPVDAFSCDHFRMYEFKVRRCARGRSHDWTECPFAHPGEKARRRDPRLYHYSGTACAEFRKGGCKKGDSCEFAHGVFECWLHPARYRTQPCKDGMGCRRRVCFFAHSPEQLRVLPQQSPRGNGSGSGDMDFESPMRHHIDSYLKAGSFVSSPTSILASPPVSPPSDSPPMSPNSPQLTVGSFNSVSDLVASMRGLQLGKARMGLRGSGLGSPRRSMLHSGFCSLPSTPTRVVPRSGASKFDQWDTSCGEEPTMERVESGRDLRAKMYAKLRKENSLGRVESGQSTAPDVGWVSELVK